MQPARRVENATRRIAGLVFACALAAPAAERNPRERWTTAADPLGAPGERESAAAANLGNLPLRFEPIAEAAGAPAGFVARGLGYGAAIRPTEVSLTLRAPDAARSRRPRGARGSRVRMRLVGADRLAQMEAVDALPGRSNYLTGNDPSKWRRGVPHYRSVRSRSVYPGIDLVYHGNGRQLEYDFEIAPGGDPSPIRLQISGLRSATIDARGDLLLQTAAGTLRKRRPVAYQLVEGKRRLVSVHYLTAVVSNARRRRIAAWDRNAVEVRFALGAYDPSRPLTIDPVLVYSTFVGGEGGATIYSVDLDPLGNVYLCGATASDLFSTTPGAYDPTFNGYNDAVILKMDPSGANLLFATYLGGTDHEEPRGMAVGADGTVYLAGPTISTDFPTTPGAFQTTYGGGGADLFVTKLNEQGTALLYSTYVGGNHLESGAIGHGLAIDAAGNAYVTGSSISANYPTTAGAIDRQRDSNEAVVTKLNGSGTALLYSTFLGGSDGEGAHDIAVDASGAVYLVGQTSSVDFPTTPGVFQPSMRGTADVFVAKLNPSGSLAYATYLGGSATYHELPLGLALGAGGQVTITGSTHSSDFPTTAGAFQTVKGEIDPLLTDSFVSRLNATGTALVYSTYLGGNGYEEGRGVTLDASGAAWVVGGTAAVNFPLADPIQAMASDNGDAFVARLNATGSALHFSTYLGGGGVDLAFGVTRDANGNLYVVGVTGSVDFPTTAGAYDRTLVGTDGFLVKIGLTPLGPPSGLTASPVSSSRIDLTWEDNSGAETGFRVDRATANGPFEPLTIIGANVTALSDAGRIANTSYRYRVRATDGVNHSEYSNIAAALTLPAAPSALAVATVSQSRLDLTWTDNNPTPAATILERSADGGSTFMPLVTVAAGGTTYADLGLTAGRTYHYRAKATNASGSSGYSNTANGTTLPDPPAAPTNLQATALSQSTIRLTWMDRSGNETNFQVEHSTDGGTTFSLLETTGPNTQTFQHNGLSAATEHWYRVRATNAGGDSAYSNTASAATLPNPPAAPTNLTATAVQPTQIDLAWRDESDNETGFKIERRTSEGAYTTITTLPANTTAFPDTSVSASLQFTYRVWAYNAGGDSSRSNEATATTPAPPCSVTVTAPNGSETWIPGQPVNITWTSANAGVAVEIALTRDGGGTWETLAAGAPNSGVFAWVVVGPPTTQAMVRVRAPSQPDCQDTSDSLFAIVLIPIELASLAIAPTAVRGGRTATGTVRLTRAAEAVGAIIALSSSPAGAILPASVTVPPGSTEASFTIRTRRVRRRTTVSVSASYEATTRTATLQIRKR